MWSPFLSSRAGAEAAWFGATTAEKSKQTERQNDFIGQSGSEESPWSATENFAFEG
jgi:hypothetical protein